MKFQLRPILSEIKTLYEKPISPSRFQEYLSKLEGDTKGDLSLPISGFNPMAKGHIIEKIEALENLEAEALMQEVIEVFNATLNNESDEKINVVLNLADDQKGGWANFYSTDFDSKFKINALVSRNFCTPYFWTSESYTKELIRLRTQDYLNRTLFWKNNSKLKNLEDHLEQEIFVSKNRINDKPSIDEIQFEKMERFFIDNKESEVYDLIFNFFYGDAASESLGYKQYGISTLSGFDFAKGLGIKREVT